MGRLADATASSLKKLPAKQIVGQDEIVEAIGAVHPIEQLPARGAAPADRFRYLDGAGTIGVIPSMVWNPHSAICSR